MVEGQWSSVGGMGVRRRLGGRGGGRDVFESAKRCSRQAEEDQELATCKSPKACIVTWKRSKAQDGKIKEVRRAQEGKEGSDREAGTGTDRVTHPPLGATDTINRGAARRRDDDEDQQVERSDDPNVVDRPPSEPDVEPDFVVWLETASPENGAAASRFLRRIKAAEASLPAPRGPAGRPSEETKVEILSPPIGRSKLVASIFDFACVALGVTVGRAAGRARGSLSAYQPLGLNKPNRFDRRPF
jgi:hypothetical protein